MINKIKNKIEEMKKIELVKESNRILRKEIEELKQEPKKLKDLITILRIEIRQLKLENKELRKELSK